MELLPPRFQVLVHKGDLPVRLAQVHVLVAELEVVFLAEAVDQVAELLHVVNSELDLVEPAPDTAVVLAFEFAKLLYLLVHGGPKSPVDQVLLLPGDAPVQQGDHLGAAVARIFAHHVQGAVHGPPDLEIADALDLERARVPVFNQHPEEDVGGRFGGAHARRDPELVDEPAGVDLQRFRCWERVPVKPNHSEFGAIFLCAALLNH